MRRQKGASGAHSTRSGDQLQKADRPGIFGFNLKDSGLDGSLHDEREPCSFTFMQGVVGSDCLIGAHVLTYSNRVRIFHEAFISTGREGGKKMRVFLALIVSVALLSPSVAMAQDECEGPADMCAQIHKLQKALKQREEAVSDARNVTEEQRKAYEKAKEEKEEESMKFVALMGVIAVILKLIVSLIKAWKSTFFKTDRGKAWVRVAVITIGIAIFITTNMGFGIPWWQAVILALGGPLSVAVHEFQKLMPVLRGQKKRLKDDASV